MLANLVCISYTWIQYSDCENKLKGALFMMGETGGNDINAALINKKSDEEIKALFPEVVETIMNATRVIFNHAVYFVTH